MHMNSRMGKAPNAMSYRSRLIQWSGIAAITGGTMFMVKAAVILFGGNQPPLLYGAAPLAFGISLLLLGTLLVGRLAHSGRILAFMTIVASGSYVLMNVLFNRELAPTAESVTALIAGFGPFVALILHGLASRRQWPSLAVWKIGPFVVASLYPLSVLAMAPVALIIDLDGATGERLIELPILLIGTGWAAFGCSLLASPRWIQRP